MSFRPAIASMSLGRAWVHSIHSKFHAAATAGLPGIEIFFEDLIYLAKSYPSHNKDDDTPSPANQILAAQEIRKLATSLNLDLIACGPFFNYEGCLDPTAQASKLDELNLWFQICHILQTDIIQIPCTFLTEGMTGDITTVARDLRHIADLGAAQNPPFRFAFENLCFGTFFDTWEKAWQVVQTVDRPNFGLCLDTYNIAGREFGDPASADGQTSPDAYHRFQASMAKMARTIDVNKVFYVQVVDGERLEGVLDEKHPFYVKEQKPRMSWSRNARLFACEEERGGYLPIEEVVRAITEGLGYKGWISMELFSRTLLEKGEDVPREHAERAVRSWERLVERMGWSQEVEGESAMKDGKGRNNLLLTEEREISARL